MRNETMITIDKEVYKFIKDYRELASYRQSFNRLTQKTYGFNFEAWYQAGYWGDKYRPYSLVHQGEVVANVSVNTIDFLIKGQLVSTIQLGTVMTDTAYRHRGLSRVLMDIVLEEYENSTDLFYLYANDTVLNFYPRFGFVEAEEYIYTRKLAKRETQYNLIKLEVNREKDMALIRNIIENTLPVARYSMIGNSGLIMFYLTSFLSDHVYYIPELEVLAVAEYEDNELQLSDLFCTHSFDLEEVINVLLTRDTIKVRLGFTPENAESFECELLKEAGTTFFVKGLSLLEKGRFPVLSHA